MKKFILATLILTGGLFSAFTYQNTRSVFAYEIFSAPYYKNLRENSPVAGKRIGFLPVMPDARACQKTTFSTPETQSLLQSFNLYIRDSLRLKAVTIPFAKQQDAPDLFLGSVTAPCRPAYLNPGMLPEHDSKSFTNRMAGQLPAKAWLKELVLEMEKQNLDYVVVPQIGEGYLYPIAKTKQRKSASEPYSAPAVGLALGTDFWLPVTQTATTMQKPVDVLFIKGLLISKEGRITRLGAEGITLASQEAFLAQTGNGINELSVTEINSIESKIHRQDLPGQPLSWKVATRNLIQTLTDSKTTESKPVGNIASK